MYIRLQFRYLLMHRIQIILCYLYCNVLPNKLTHSTFNSTSEDTLLISDNNLTKDNMSAGSIPQSDTPVINGSQAAIIAILKPRFKCQLHTQVCQQTRAI